MSFDPSPFQPPKEFQQPANPYSSPQHSGFGPPPSGPNNGMAIASLVFGIAGLPSAVLGFCCCFLVGIPLPTIALGLGIAALRDPRLDSNGRGMATAGIICGAIGLLIAAGSLVMTFLAVGMNAFQPNFKPPFE